MEMRWMLDIDEMEAKLLIDEWKGRKRRKESSESIIPTLSLHRIAIATCMRISIWSRKRPKAKKSEDEKQRRSRCIRRLAFFTLFHGPLPRRSPCPYGTGRGRDRLAGSCRRDILQSQFASCGPVRSPGFARCCCRG